MGVRMTFESERKLANTLSAHQQVTIFQNKRFGTVLMLDGVTQVTTGDEFIYHEMMSHVPLFAHGNAREILIIGGGDCGIAEEVLKHTEITRLTLVEIDDTVVQFCRKYFPEISGPVFSDPRFELLIADGVKYVTETKRRFDIIIVDSTDPHGPGTELFTPAFYTGCKACLAPGGLMVTQSGVPFFQMNDLLSTLRHFRELFADAGCYIAAVPSYIGGHMAMGWATDDFSLRRMPVDTIEKRYAVAGHFGTQYWTPAVHCAAFALPRFIAEKTEVC
jgi:spermidine synthase